MEEAGADAGVSLLHKTEKWYLAAAQKYEPPFYCTAEFFGV